LWPQESVEECETAAEFLLEPWILVQLPFQPLLLHQWSVALLAEALKLKQKLGELHSVPTQLISPVTKLLEMNKLMFHTAFSFFAHYNFYVHEGCESLSNSVSSVFLHQIPEVLPVIEFILSGECDNIIKALTKIALDSVSTDYQDKNKDFLIDGGEFSFCYNPSYWKQKSLVHSMYCKEASSPKDNSKPDQFYNVNVLRDDITASEVEELQSLIVEKFIDTDMINGESKEFIFGLLGGKTLHVLIDLYRDYKETKGWLNKLQF